MKASKEIALPARDYQPTKAEIEEEHDMPGADMEVLRRAFFEPVKIRRESLPPEGRPA